MGWPVALCSAQARSTSSEARHARARLQRPAVLDLDLGAIWRMNAVDMVGFVG